jgi:hypothetical protein
VADAVSITADYGLEGLIETARRYYPLRRAITRLQLPLC